MTSVSLLTSPRGGETHVRTMWVVVGKINVSMCTIDLESFRCQWKKIWETLARRGMSDALV